MNAEFLMKASRVALIRNCGIACVVGGALGAYLKGYAGALPILLGLALLLLARSFRTKPIVKFAEDALYVQELSVGSPTKVLFSAIRGVEETESLIILETPLEKVRIPRGSLELADVADIRQRLGQWLDA